MKKYDKIRIEQDELVDVFCDLCGEKCTGVHGIDYTYGFQFSTFSADWGYDSLHDNEVWDFQFCIKCSEKLFKKIRKNNDRGS